MFTRPEQNYEVPDEIVDAILSDPAHPLSCIAELVQDGNKILDIGAGSGVLGRVLARKGLNLVVDGVEPNAFAANLARRYYRNTYVGLVQEFYDQISAVQYDFIILADVIEHMPNPQEVLSDLLKHLSPKTKLIISVPNVAFGSVRLALMNGNFDYVDSGLLERTHLRFFTKTSLNHFFSIVGLKVERAFSLERSFYRTEFNRHHLSASIFTILKLAVSDDARAYQYLYLLSIPDNAYAVRGLVKMEQKGANWWAILLDYLISGSELDGLIRKVVKRVERFNG